MSTATLSQPPRPTPAPSRGGSESASPRTLAAIAVVGGCGALLFRDRVGGVGVTVFMVLLVAAVWVASRPVRPAHIGLAALALLISVVFSVRSSSWVLVPSAVSLIVVTLAWVGLPRWASVFDVSWTSAARWTRQGTMEAFRAPRWAASGATEVVQRTGRGQLLGWIRGAAITLPLFVGLFLLLASADPVFGTALRPTFSPSSALTTLAIATAASLVALVLTRVARVESLPHDPQRGARLGQTEALIVLTTIAVLFTAFIGVQLMTSNGAGLASLQAQGISVAEYARSGYFQLLAVVFITTATLIAVDALRRPTGEPRHSERALSILIVLLTFTILVVAMHRLALYVDTFGWTMLRLACIPGAIWMASLLLMVVAWVMGLGRRHNWLLGGVGAALVVTTLGFAAFNPEAFVVSHNVDRVSQVPLDTSYLTTLSDDAVPELVSAMEQLPPADAAYLRMNLCED